MGRLLKQSLGIDVSKSGLSVCLGSLNDRLEKRFRTSVDVCNSLKGYKELSKWLSRSVDANVGLHIVMEATGVYHQGVALYLHGLGHTVCVMQSGRVKKYAQSLDQRSKTDALDSKMLSMLGLERQLRAWEPPSNELRYLKALGRERSTLLKDRTVEMNRQDAIDSGAYHDKRAIKRHNKRIKLINAQIKDIEREILEITDHDPALKRKLGHLVSIPGVSFITAAAIVGETMGFEAITNIKQLTSYAGYDVVLRESGNYRGKPRISKKGNSNIRGALHMPSMTCARCNPSLKPFYDRLKAKKAKPLIALVAVQRKLLILMYTLWKKEVDYQPDFEQKKQQKPKAFAARDNDLINQIAS